MTHRKQIASQRRAKQAAKKRSAAGKMTWEQTAGTKQVAEKVPVSKGHEFNRAAKAAKKVLALAPDGPFSPISSSQLIEIEKPLYGGSFLARLEGKAVFVPLTLPGEQARVRILQSKSGYATAEAEEIVRPAPQRILPACPHFGACGGCHYQHTDYATQLAFKQATLRETLARGGVAVPAEIAVLAAEPWRYRNRIRLAFDATGNLGYRGRRSHAVIPISECPIAAPLLLEAAQAFTQVVRGCAPLPRFTEIALFCNPAETALLASVFTKSPAGIRFDELALALHKRIPALVGAELVVEGLFGAISAAREPRVLAQWDANSLAYHAAGFDYRVDHGSFFQVNRWLVDALVERVAANHSGNLAWDLFAGVGLFARQLAASFAHVVAVESAPSATAALEANLRGTAGAAVKAETLAFLRRSRSGEQPGLIVVDPPRAGLGAETCALLGEIAAQALVYVSCDPATLARDLCALLAAGYAIESITLADLFPQTFHLETVLQLRRA
jgi:23S rRNA (uracil1939-C5)-methyltransferase